jgi:GTP cyclohydrolase I
MKMEAKKLREPLSEQEIEKFEGYAAAIFSRMGMDLASPGSRETPRRWVTALWDMTEGYDGDSKLSTLFPVECPA